MDTVTKLRHELLPLLEEQVRQLQLEHPGVAISVWDSPVGSRTTYQGHCLGIDCVLANQGSNEPDNVALELSVKHLDREPLIDAAIVGWGHPSDHVEADLVVEPVAFSEEQLRRVLDRLPELIAALRRALHRGRPPS
ncbi:hypothetical protein HPC49_14170 [Pyxidicoccus fallax]|uniref:Uncharacterized protein n=1 Tax=Pyxidicoccus fallax TaxID=394095 RepID=A0A848LK98_9BACT|nr:hypothetical protein [Pyxidicoccus fallax]NMO18149.1 hypothetical protein [Pyxidicoccus fallax]NPC79380.1 hypothetical protein [Pyxidicoccus fallax]